MYKDTHIPKAHKRKMVASQEIKKQKEKINCKIDGI